jgi:hypothetical protein
MNKTNATIKWNFSPCSSLLKTSLPHVSARLMRIRWGQTKPLTHTSGHQPTTTEKSLSDSGPALFSVTYSDTPFPSVCMRIFDHTRAHMLRMFYVLTHLIYSHDQRQGREEGGQSYFTSQRHRGGSSCSFRSNEPARCPFHRWAPALCGGHQRHPASKAQSFGVLRCDR